MPHGRQTKRRRKRLFHLQGGACYYCRRQMVLIEQHTKTPPKNMATIEHFDDRFSERRGKVPGVRTALVCLECNNNANREMVSRIPLDELWRRSGAYPMHYRESALATPPGEK